MATRPCTACRLPYIALHEPEKHDSAVSTGDGAGRRADVVIADLERNASYTTIVDLSRRHVDAWRAITNGQAPWSNSESPQVTAALEGDRRWLAGLRRRGIRSLTDIIVAPVMASDQPDNGHRRVRVLAFLRADSANSFATPIEGLTAIVDPTTRTVEGVTDVGPGVPSEAARLARTPDTSAMPPAMYVCQPKGPAFALNGREVRWQGWRFRLGWHVREGVVLYGLARRDGPATRPVLARTLSEMSCRTDRRTALVFRAALDEGEYMLGGTVDSLIPGRPASAHFSPWCCPTTKAPRE